MFGEISEHYAKGERDGRVVYIDLQMSSNP